MKNTKKLALVAVLTGLSFTGGVFAASEPGNFRPHSGGHYAWAQEGVQSTFSPEGLRVYNGDSVLGAIRSLLGRSLRPTVSGVWTEFENWDTDEEGKPLEADVFMAKQLESRIAKRYPATVKGLVKQQAVPRLAQATVRALTGEKDEQHPEAVFYTKAVFGAGVDALSVPRDHMAYTFVRSGIKTVVKEKVIKATLKQLGLYEPSFLQYNVDADGKVTDSTPMWLLKATGGEAYEMTRDALVNMLFDACYDYAGDRAGEFRIAFTKEFKL